MLLVPNYLFFPLLFSQLFSNTNNDIANSYIKTTSMDIVYHDLHWFRTWIFNPQKNSYRTKIKVKW